MNTFDLSRLCARVLTCKEMNDEEITMLLSAPQWCDPMRAVGMREVIDRICLAREQKEQVLVCGDYDADGICGTPPFWWMFCAVSAFKPDSIFQIV